jgi:uncharacterized lipoprotein YajG
MMKQMILAAALCALAGCAVPMQTVDASREACASYGFQPGSGAFVNCVMTEQRRHTLHVAIVPTAAPYVPVQQAPPLPAAPAAPTIAMPEMPMSKTQFCFGAGAFQHCQ